MSLPSLHELIEEPTNRITFWTTSTDVICPPESPHSHKGTARHLIHSQVWDLVGSHCPRCNDDWGRAKDGLQPCLTRGCYTWKQTGKRKTPSLMTEEQIMFDEFEDDLHDEIANDIEGVRQIHPSVKPEDEIDVLLGLYKEKKHHPLTGELSRHRAKENVDIPPTESNVISDPREQEFGWGDDEQFGGEIE